MWSRDRTRLRDTRRSGLSPTARHVLWGLVVCTLVLLIVFGTWHLTRLPILTIEEVVITGGKTISHEVVKEEVDTILSRSYFKIIPHTFAPLYPRDSVAAAVLSLPRIKSSLVERRDNTLHVSFTEYTPYALWCKSEAYSGNCYFLDETGYAFGSGPHLEGGALVRHTFEEDMEFEKKQVFPESHFRETHAFLARLHEYLRLRVTDVFYTKENDLILRVNGGGELFLSRDMSYESAFLNLESILASKEFKHLKPGNFRYIDLRFGNKVFVNEELEPTSSGTTTTTSATST